MKAEGKKYYLAKTSMQASGEESLSSFQVGMGLIMAHLGPLAGHLTHGSTLRVRRLRREEVPKTGNIPSPIALTGF